MSSQYHFQLVFLRLTLKRNILSQSNLKITLLQNRKEQDPSSLPLQSQDIKVKKNQRIIDLDTIKTFNFTTNAENSENRFTIKYEIKGNGEDRVRAIPVDIMKMIREYQNNKKTIFQQSFGGENAQLSYKFYLSEGESEHKIDLLASPENKQTEGDQMVRSNSINRSKRPPNLKINRITNSPNHTPQDTPKAGQKHEIKHLSYEHPALAAMSPISPDVGRMPHLSINENQDDNNSSVSGTHKKIANLPMADIQKVNELIATHHRPHADHHSSHHLSYKLKIVIVMLVIGAAFLIFDTLSDRKLRGRKSAEEHAHHDQHHPSPHQEQKQKSKPKKASHSKHASSKQQRPAQKPSKGGPKKAKKE